METLTFATTKGVLLLQQKERHEMATYYDVHFKTKRAKALVASLRVSFPRGLIEVTALCGDSPRNTYDDLSCAIGAIADVLNVEILDCPDCFDV